MTVEERIARLEQQNRRMKVAVSVIVVAVLGGVLVAGPLLPRQANAQTPSAPRIVEANEFRLLDESGRVRGRFAVDKDGPGLAFGDENGKLRAALRVDKDGPLLLFNDKNEKLRAVLAMDKD
jgi:hypothetical protein